ncbi:dolichol kinase [Angomonas deanei]|nr:dolichol kinase [Angomonas deanei]|eukprot:EPY35484.1 dolichol kinase [Angomonas deanei]
MRSPLRFRRSGKSQERDGKSDEPTRSSKLVNNNGVPKKRTFFKVEISYSSTLLFIWIFLLCTLCWTYNLKMQATTMMLLTCVALTSIHGESRTLVPLIFLAESCCEVAMGHQHSPLEFYASTILSFLSLLACKAERKGNSLKDRNVLLETIFCGAAGVCVTYIIIKDEVFSFGAAAYVAMGHAFFLQLYEGLGENEAALVSSLIGFFFGDVFTNNNLSTSGGRESVLMFNTRGNYTTYTYIMSRGSFLCVIYMAVSCFVFSRFCMVPVNKNSKSSPKRVSRKRITFIFWTSLLIVHIGMLLMLHYQFMENPITWFYGYILSSSFRTWTLLAWSVTLPIAIAVVELFTKRVRSTIHRKMYHFIAVVAMTPAAMIDPPFLSLMISFGTTLFIVLEIARVYQVYGTKTLAAFIQRHIDHRESVTGLVRTHIYLIFGFGLPLILRYRHLHLPPKPIPAVMELSQNIIPGILSLGIIDSAAAIIGSSFMLSYRRALGSYLKNKLFTVRANSSISHKTTTGTLGGFICGVLFWLFILKVAEVPIFALPTLYSFLMVPRPR